MKSYYVLTALIIAIVFTHHSSAQPLFKQTDVITFTDSRDAMCVEIGRLEIYVATNGGIWRFLRLTGSVLDPWFTGVSQFKALPLKGARIVLWNNISGTLWVVAEDGLVYYRSDTKEWYKPESHYLIDRQIISLGEEGSRIFLQCSGEKDLYFSVDSFTGVVLKSEDRPDGDVRWVNPSQWRPHEFDNYLPEDISIFYDRSDGKIKDWVHDVYRPVYEAIDERESKRYLCYPGLGLVIADDFNHTLRVVQLGPAGRNVRAIGLSPDDIWLGGDNARRREGYSRLNRKQGRWERYSRDLNFGIDSQRAWDVSITGGRIYFATDQGLVSSNPDGNDWRTFDRFDGLNGSELRSLTAGQTGHLYIGGEWGVNIFTLPFGPIWKSGSEKPLIQLTTDLLLDGNMLWTVGMEGVIRLPVRTNRKLDPKPDLISVEPSQVIDIQGDKIWIASASSVSAFDRESLVEKEQFGVSAYFNGSRPLSLTANDSLLWVGTTNGLYRYNSNRNHWIEYTMNQGLPHNRIERIIIEADSLWIGTPMGLTRFIWNRPERDVY